MNRKNTFLSVGTYLYGWGALLLLLLMAGPAKAGYSTPPPLPDSTLGVAASGDSLCYGDSLDVFVALSEIGVSYQLVDSFSGAPFGGTLMGTGGTIALPSGPLFTNSVLSILATDTSDGSTAILINQVFVTVLPGIEGAIFPDSVPTCPDDTIDFALVDWALDFDGATEYVQVPTGPGLAITNEITVEAWINADVWTANRQEGVVVSTLNFAGATGNEGFELRCGGGGIVDFEIGINGSFLSYEAFSAPLMATGTWYHIAGTYDGNFVRVYLNGVLQNTTPIVGTIGVSSLDLHLGRQALFPVGRFFDGQVDEVRIWNYARTAGELQAGMDQVLGGNESGLMAYYRMNDGPGSAIVTDNSSNSNQGAFVNMSPVTNWVPTGPLLPVLGSYSWAFGDGNTSILAMPPHAYTSPGTYTASVILTDTFGCTNQFAAPITIDPGPTVNLGPDTVQCGGAGQVDLDAQNPGLTWSWSTGATTQMIQVTSTDTFSVEVTDANGCVARDSIFVGFGSDPVVNLGPDTSLCATGVVVLDAGNPGLDFLWSNGATTQTINVATADTFSVVVSDSVGCNGTDSIVVTGGAIPTVNLGPDTTLCAGNAVVLDAGNGGASYLWSTGATSQSITVAVADTYFVAVTNLSGCTGTDTLVVTLSGATAVNLGPDTTLCDGASIILDAGNPGATYMWSTGATTQTINVSVAGWVSVEVVDSNNCPSTDSILVGVWAGPGSFLPPTASFCAGDSVQLASGAQAVLYDWSNGATTPTITVGVPGTFSLTLQDTNNCMWMDTIQVIENPLPNVALGGAAPAYCFGDPAVNLFGTPQGGTFQGAGINGNVFDPSLLNPPDTTLLIYAFTDLNGCTNADSSLVIVRALPAVGFAGLSPTNCSNGPAENLTGNPLGGIFSGPGITGAVFDPALAGAGSHPIDYSFTDGFGCTGVETQTVEVFPAPLVTLTAPFTVLCSNSPGIALNVSPLGGTLGGNGIAGTSFDPALAGLGTHPIGYAYTDPNGCSDTDSLTMEVVLQPVASFTGLAPNYCENDPTVLLQGQPLGGSFSGPGVGPGTFDPGAVAPGGTYPIVYTYSVSAGCVDADTQQVTVFPAPNVVFSPLEPVYCSGATPIQLTAQPAGGQFSGPAVTGAQFDPAQAPTGNALNLVYLYTDANGCTNADSVTTTVAEAPLPADAGPDMEVYFSSSTLLSAAFPPIGTGSWQVVSGSGTLSDMASATSSVSGLTEGENRLQWVVQNGPCIETDEVILLVQPYDPVRGFSPNGDGLNDVFEIPGLMDYPNSKLQVFDQLGNLVYSSGNYGNDWGGLAAAGEELPEDTYYYTLEVSNGTRVKGLVLLKR